MRITMNPSLQNLIDRYLDGTASAAEIRRLDDIMKQDEAAREALLLAATLEGQLRRLLTDAGQDRPSPLPAPERAPRAFSWRRTLRYAAVLLVTAGGWAGAMFFAYRYFELQRQSERAPKLMAEVPIRETGNPKTQQPQIRPVGRNQVIETRGLVLAFPGGKPASPTPGNDAAIEPNDWEEAVPISVGGEIPNGKRLWTCPWGGAAIRLADGSSMQLDRSTVVSFTESQGKRRLKISQGVFFLTRQDASNDHGISVLTDQASIDVVDAQVAVAVDKWRTLIEVAEGEVEVAPVPEGPGVMVPAGHYLIVGASAEPKAVEGRLVWRLEPAKRGEYDPKLP
jgi:ferric-dicitrate binding protein FerR (iron transport regulator)